MAGEKARSNGPVELVLVGREIHSIPRIKIGLRRGNKLIPRAARVQTLRALEEVTPGSPFRIEMHYEGKEVSTEVWVYGQQGEIHVYEWNEFQDSRVRVLKLMHQGISLDYALGLQHDRALAFIRTDMYPTFNSGYGGW